jgi:hypothetical protein
MAEPLSFRLASLRRHARESDALGLDVTVKADRAKVAGMVRQWIAVGMLTVVMGKDDKRRPRPFVEIGQGWRSTLTPGHFPGATAAPPPPATP